MSPTATMNDPRTDVTAPGFVPKNAREASALADHTSARRGQLSYPMAMYRPNPDRPNGYTSRVVQNRTEHTSMAEAGWYDDVSEAVAEAERLKESQAIVEEPLTPREVMLQRQLAEMQAQIAALSATGAGGHKEGEDAGQERSDETKGRGRRRS